MKPSVRQEILGRISDNLRAARVGQRLTQEMLARRSGLHRTEIGKLEKGERLPRIDTAVKLATALEVPLDQLVDGIELAESTSERFRPTATRRPTPTPREPDAAPTSTPRSRRHINRRTPDTL